MALSESLSSAAGKISEKLGEQVWFQELKLKWQELDPGLRANLALLTAGLSAIALGGLLLYGGVTASRMQSEYEEKSELLEVLARAGEELRQLKSSGITLPSGSAEGDWPSYFEQLATSAGIDRAALSLTPEKTAAPAGSGTAAKGKQGDSQGSLLGGTQETTLEIAVKGVPLRQLTRFAHLLETGERPVKIRDLVIEGKGEPSTPLNAQLTVSAFTIQP
jgi:hypothetical protein